VRLLRAGQPLPASQTPGSTRVELRLKAAKQARRRHQRLDETLQQPAQTSHPGAARRRQKSDGLVRASLTLEFESLCALPARLSLPAIGSEERSHR
jgi:hypothetical protein